MSLPPPPPAPMAPHFDQGPYQGIPEGVIPVDDYHVSPYPNDFNNGPQDYLDEYDDNTIKPKTKQNKNSAKDDKSTVETKYEIYTLQRAAPKTGEEPSWSRVAKRLSLLDETRLLEGVRSHEKRETQPGNTFQQEFNRLRSNQREVIDRIVIARKQLEKSKNGDWGLAHIKRRIRRGSRWSRTPDEVTKIEIVLRGKHVSKFSDSSLQYPEIIDLNERFERKKDKSVKDDKKVKKSKSFDDLDRYDNQPGLGILPPPPPSNYHARQHEHVIQQPMLPPPPPPQSMGPYPFESNGPGIQQPQFQQQWPQNPRQSFTSENPFQPHPGIAVPAQFDSALMQGQEWPHPPHLSRHGTRDRSNSHSRHRRPSTRRQSADVKRIKALETKVDDLLNSKVENWKINGDSSDDTYDDDSIFSPGASEGRSWTPPSSPHSTFSDVRPKGSLERRRSSGNPRYQPKRSSYRYRDVEVEPGYTYRAEPQEYAPRVRQQSKRPSLHHAATHDDYPMGRVAEPRYAPAPQRRLTDYAEDLDNGYYDDESRRRRRGRPEPIRRSTIQYDAAAAVQDAYEAGRRDSAREDRSRGYPDGGRYR